MNRSSLSLFSFSSSVSLLLLVLGMSSVLSAQGVRTDGPAVSPFRGMRAVESGIEVQVADDAWWGLEKVAGVDTATLLRESKRLCGDAAWKRITEDLPALLEAMGHQVEGAVDLEVRDLATGEPQKLSAVVMTAENRRRLREANRADGRRAARPAAAAVAASLSAAAARDDLETLQRLLDERFAYRHLRAVDLGALLRDARVEIGDGPIKGPGFARIVDRILRAFGDGHSRLDDVPDASSTCLPCLVQVVEGGAVAFLADRSGFVDPERPFLTAIDGVPLAKWLAAARARVTRGSEVMQAQQSERLLRNLGLLRTDLGIDLGASAGNVTLTLRGAAGESDHVQRATGRRPTYGEWPRTATRELDGIGYLRLAAMDDDAAFLDGLDAAMVSFRGTKGLVIDVRGNGGGSRDALRRLAPYFLPPAGEPVIGNVAAVLVERGQPARVDALADRGLWPVEWSGWTAAQRAAITKCARNWQPSWKPTAGKFSPWHFLVLDRADNPRAFAYERPVVVLIDRGCFSATDVFAAALGALPNVRLVGEPTSGGSGRAKGYRLPQSGLRLQLSTMASFRPDGVLFEGNGVAPDVVVATLPGDLIGATDTVLQRALELLR